MQTQKMSLASIKGKLSRAEMKNIMAGSGSGAGCKTGGCSVYNSANGQTYSGSCSVYIHPGAHSGSPATSHCICWNSSLGHYVSTNGYAACTA
jgi:hypothetical protein